MKKIVFWELYAWVNRGRQRKEVLRLLPKTPLTAEVFRKEVNSKTNLRLSLREMSRHLTSFKEKGILTCLTPEAPYGRLYVLTKKGKELLSSLESI